MDNLKKFQDFQDKVNVVPKQLFDGKIESEDISIVKYMLQDDIEIVSFRQCERLINCWASQELKWHLKRGLLVKYDGAECDKDNSRRLRYDDIRRQPNSLVKSYQSKCQARMICVSSINPATHTISSHGTRGLGFGHEVHFFQENSRSWQTHLKQALGPGVYVGKYDIQGYNKKAPPGTSVFQLQKEREFAEKNHRELTERHEKNAKDAAQKLLDSKIKKDPPEPIMVPLPPSNHVICAICREQFTDYYEHITSEKHRRGVESKQAIYDKIDDLIEFMDNERKQEPEEKSSTEEILATGPMKDDCDLVC